MTAEESRIVEVLASMCASGCLLEYNDLLEDLRAQRGCAETQCLSNAAFLQATDWLAYEIFGSVEDVCRYVSRSGQASRVVVGLRESPSRPDAPQPVAG